MIFLSQFQFVSNFKTVVYEGPGAVLLLLLSCTGAAVSSAGQRETKGDTCAREEDGDHAAGHTERGMQSRHCARDQTTDSTRVVILRTVWFKLEL